MSASAAATDGALTAVGCDPVGSATRGRYPPPRLSRFSVGWRYGLAITNYVLGATLLVLLVMRPTLLGESEPPFPLPPALLVIDLALGIVALVIIRLRRRYPLLVACVTSAMMLVSQTSGVVAAWALVSVSTHRRVATWWRGR